MKVVKHSLTEEPLKTCCIAQKRGWEVWEMKPSPRELLQSNATEKETKKQVYKNLYSSTPVLPIIKYTLNLDAVFFYTSFLLILITLICFLLLFLKDYLQ